MNFYKGMTLLQWAALIMFGVNAGAAVGMAWRHQWAIAGTCVIWTGNVVLWMHIIRKIMKQHHREREQMQELWNKIREQDETIVALFEGKLPK